MRTGCKLNNLSEIVKTDVIERHERWTSKSFQWVKGTLLSMKRRAITEQAMAKQENDKRSKIYSKSGRRKTPAVMSGGFGGRRSRNVVGPIS